MANADAENSSSYSAFERFLIWFLIPFVFTSVLLGVLLTIFDYDVKNDVLKTVGKIPFVGKVIPSAYTKSDAPASTAATKAQPQDEETSNKAQEQLLATANQKLAEKDAELQKAEADIMQRDQTIKELQNQKSSLDEQMKQKAQKDEEYSAQIQQLASMYAKMNPSKSAPIMENLTPSEQVLVLGMMKQDDRVKILEKMDPKKAAEASIMLKDQVSAKDRELAALQERLKQMNGADTKAATKLTKDDLGSTFANMTPKSAATVLLEMQNNSPDKVISILSSMDSAGRSKIITAMSEQSKETAALISARLAQ
ncbi:hypothetical protein [Paenibacillus thalictri]|uniref:Magnesium transporter MgtE intracellular domain-containing protein n=1 Tax=Paenibacillus thalictri TaxID=2527873 RepID=A0A4V2J443_9BACL|nr:hypothetical protein [Paenibacillus thalictri]TBL77729.1 hypothetical protein EYB31_16435 [Paenibacillus thalictri]